MFCVFLVPSSGVLKYSEIAEFFFVDTTPFVDKYFLRPKHHRYDWRGVLPRKEYLSNLLKVPIPAKELWLWTSQIIFDVTNLIGCFEFEGRIWIWH